MGGSIDFGAVALYVIFALTVASLCYFLFEARKLSASMRTQKYEAGHPMHDKLKSAEGVMEVKGSDLVFRDPERGGEYFSVPLENVRRVSKSGESTDREDIIRKASKLLDEREYMQLEFEEGGKWHTVRLSAHKLANVNDEVINNILAARSASKGSRRKQWAKY